MGDKLKDEEVMVVVTVEVVIVAPLALGMLDVVLQPLRAIAKSPKHRV